MQRRYVFLLFAVVLALVLSVYAYQCSDRSSPLPPKGGERSPLAKLEPRPYRVVGLRDTCADEVPGQGGKWHGKNVFLPKARNQGLPKSMRELCAYDWRPNGDTPTAAPEYDLVDDPKHPLEPDHPVVTTLGEVNMEELRENRRLAYFNEVDGLKPLPGKPIGRVWISFPDSSPRNEGDEITVGTDAHGFNVAWVARYLTCPDGPDANTPCISKIHMEPALDHRAPPVVPDAVSAQGGVGSYGTRTALAEAIFNTVEAWKEAGGDKDSHLVINLSVGWEPDLECVTEGTPNKGSRELVPKLDETAEAWIRRVSGCVDGASTGPRQSVLEAITYAVCHNALVLAAAGNDTGYNPPLRRPVYPAAWENVPMPPPRVCEELFEKPVVGTSQPPPKLPELSTNGNYRPLPPLLYAIGGVGIGDAPIPNTRPEGMPRLLAPASLAVAHPDNREQDGYRKALKDCHGCSHPLTGTSMATAVASGTAAAVWAYRPALGPHEVMDLLWENGKELSYMETFQRAVNDPAHRISFCNAIKHAIDDAGKDALKDCFSWESGTARNVQMAVTKDGTPSMLLERPEKLLGAVSGQPGKGGCPDCVIVLTDDKWGIYQGSVYNSYFIDNPGIQSLSNPVLRFFDASGAEIVAARTTLRLYGASSSQGALLSSATQSGTVPGTKVANVRGSGTVTGSVRYADIAWARTLAGGTTKTAVLEGVLISGNK